MIEYTNNQTAIITGGAKRVGAIIANHLAAQGFNLAIHSNTSFDQAQILCKTLQKRYNVCCKAYYADLTSTNQAIKMMNSIFDTFNNVSLLINNASSFLPSMFQNLTIDRFDVDFNVHVKTPLFMIQNLVYRVTHKTNIINILDIQVIDNTAGELFFSYLFAKKCLATLTEMLSLVLPKNITINSIAPGMMMKFDNPSTMEAEIEKSYIKGQKRVTKIEDFLNTIDLTLTNQSNGKMFTC